MNITIDAMNYKQISDHIIVRAVNKKHPALNQEICASLRHGDVALVLYLMISAENNQLLSTPVAEKMMEAWCADGELSFEEIFARALANTAKLFPPVIYTDLPSMFSKTGHDLASMNSKPKGNIFVLTTTFEVNGATALWYPGVQQKLYQLIGQPYFAVCTSTTEVMIHPASMFFPEIFLSSVRKINRSFNTPADCLSDQLFCFDGSTLRPYEEHQEDKKEE